MEKVKKRDLDSVQQHVMKNKIENCKYDLDLYMRNP